VSRVSIVEVQTISQHQSSPPDLDESLGGSESALPFECRLAANFAALEISRVDWDTATAELGGSVYMSFDWVRTWWEFYGAGKDLRLFVCSAGRKIVGIIPLYIDSIGLGPLRFRVARLVGANIPPKAFNPPIHEAWAETIFQEILTQLFEKGHCDVLSFGPVSELQKSIHALETVSVSQSSLVGSCAVIRDVHSVFWLPKDMEEYYESLSKNERKNRRKYELRLLKKEYETKVEVVTQPAAVLEEFDRFAVQHAEQWRAEGKSGHFGAWPMGLEFNRALVRAQANLGRLRFIRIAADGEVIANQYTYAFGDAYYWELPSRAIAAQWDRFSLGPTGIVTMIDVGIQEGKKRLEGGLAHYDYKLRLGAKEYQTLTVRVIGKRIGSRTRACLFGFFRSVLSIAYHKIWYRRLMPRLPASVRRPQWRLWLRLDF
jgi:CelD/BcsL family acetyltransferase involved in cellulose biosynthesis